YVNFPMNGFDTPTPDQIAKVLALMGTADTVFVHCKLGKDRTGTVIAAYRIAAEGWTNDRAYDEAKERGIHWYAGGMKRFTRSSRPAPTVTLASPAASGARAPESPSAAPAHPTRTLGAEAPPPSPESDF